MIGSPLAPSFQGFWPRIHKKLPIGTYYVFRQGDTYASYDDAIDAAPEKCWIIEPAAIPDKYAIILHRLNIDPNRFSAGQTVEVSSGSIPGKTIALKAILLLLDVYTLKTITVSRRPFFPRQITTPPTWHVRSRPRRTPKQVTGTIL